MRKQEVLKCVVICPKSLSKKVAEFVPGWSGLHRALWVTQQRVALSSKCQVQRLTLHTVSILCPGPHLPLCSLDPNSFSPIPTESRTPGTQRERALWEVTWVGLQQADSRSNCGQVSKAEAAARTAVGKRRMRA